VIKATVDFGGVDFATLKSRAHDRLNAMLYAGKFDRPIGPQLPMSETVLIHVHSAVDDEVRTWIKKYLKAE
jgi:hypothetical protein